MRIDEKIVKCPICKKATFTITSYKDYFNDRGGIIAQMDECGHKFPYPVVNPEEAQIENAQKIDTWDNDLPEYKEEVLKKHNFKTEREFAFEVLHFIPESEPQRLIYERNEYSIFQDPIKKINYEDIAYDELNKHLQEIQSQYVAYRNVYLKGRWGNPKYIYLIIDLPDNNKAFFYREFNEKIDFTQNLQFNLLADIKNFKLERNLDGTFSKNESLAILRKCIIRWNVMFQHILIATPFVGHQWNKESEIFDLWEWLLNYLIPNKTTLITRKATLDKFKKVSKNTGINIDILKEFNLNIPVIEDYIKKQDFHAKFYAGISDDDSEILSGSVNILKGPSIENFAFSKQPTDSFNIKYLENMKIEPISLNNQENEILVIYSNESNGFSSKLEKQIKDANEVIKKYY